MFLCIGVKNPLIFLSLGKKVGVKSLFGGRVLALRGEQARETDVKCLISHVPQGDK
jgi:hypothetical protein